MVGKFLKPIGVEHQKYPLCGLDLLFGFHFVYTTICLSERCDLSRLESALQETVNRIPVLAGKIEGQGNQLAINTDGFGVHLTYEAVDLPPPSEEQLSFLESSFTIFNPTPNIFEGDISNAPLLSIRITTFNDGKKYVGICHNHALMDGTSMYAFLRTWSDAAEGIESTPQNFSREAVTSLGDHNAKVPSGQSGVAVQNDQLIQVAPLFFPTQFHTMHVTDEYERVLAAVKKRNDASVSVNHLMSALIFKTYSLCCVDDNSSIARANMSYDLRMQGGVKVPFSFFGNAVLFRNMSLSFEELRSADLWELAARFKQLVKISAENVSQDIGFYEAQYQLSEFNKLGAFTNFTTALANGGIYINNLLNFVETSSWKEFFSGQLDNLYVVLPRAFGVRTAMLLPRRQGGVMLRVALEDHQIGRFKMMWSNLAAELMV